MESLLTPIDYADDKGTKSQDEWKETYDTNNLRQIVLIYELEEYEEILGLIGRIRDVADLESNTEAVTEAIRAYKVEG